MQAGRPDKHLYMEGEVSGQGTVASSHQTSSAHGVTLSCDRSDIVKDYFRYFVCIIFSSIPSLLQMELQQAVWYHVALSWCNNLNGSCLFAAGLPTDSWQPKLPNFIYSSNTTSWRLMRRANNNNNMVHNIIRSKEARRARKQNIDNPKQHHIPHSWFFAKGMHPTNSTNCFYWLTRLTAIFYH